jgi:hypothetical protein
MSADLTMPPCQHAGLAKRLAAVGLALAGVAACSSSSGHTAVSTGNAPPTSAASTTALVGQVHKLTAELGCPGALVVAGTAFAEGAETAECDQPTYYGIFVFPSTAARDAWLHEARSVGGFYVTGPTWAVQASTTGDLAAAVKATGGSTMASGLRGG